MKIACLGWGSLVWDTRELPVASDWFQDGPHLPLEFSRQSADDRITLVIDESADPSPALWALIHAQSLSEAIGELSRREGAKANTIGRWPGMDTNFYPYSDKVENWALTHGIDAVVWTALPPGMRSSRGVSPSLAELIGHLRSLDSGTCAKAAEYVFKAPGQIKTRYRPALETF